MALSYIQTKHDWSKARHFNVSVTQNASHGGAWEKRAKTLAINAIAAHFFSGYASALALQLSMQ